jgi:phosphonatase-like hydrolase
MMIKLVVFDMAGTTVDEQNVVYKTVHQALLRAGMEVSLETVLLHAAGKEKFQAIKDVIEAENATGHINALAVFQDFEQLLDEAYATLMPLPMPGVETVFARLRARNIRIVLNTGYKNTVARGLLEKLGWEEGLHFNLLITADDVERGRPYPDMILLAMAKFEITDAASVAKIGDSKVDIEEGKSAGCGIYAGITTGAQTAEQLAEAAPTHILNALEALLPLL